MAGLGSKTEHLRHPAELRLLILGTIVFVALLVGLAMLLEEWFGPGGIAGLALAVVGLYVSRGLINGVERANSIELTPEQFPDVHQRIGHYAGVFGLDAVPKAYTAQAGGTLNAFASKHNRTDFIRINAEILEVGEFGLGPREVDTAALDFIIAHELGHVAAKHTTYWYTFIAGYVAVVPFIGSAMSRAREYTADNHGYAAVPDGINGIVLLSGGKYLYPRVDGRQLAGRASTDLGAFVWVINALASHPTITKRLEALYDRSRPGRIF